MKLNLICKRHTKTPKPRLDALSTTLNNRLWSSQRVRASRPGTEWPVSRVGGEEGHLGFGNGISGPYLASRIRPLHPVLVLLIAPELRYAVQVARAGQYVVAAKSREQKPTFGSSTRRSTVAGQPERLAGDPSLACERQPCTAPRRTLYDSTRAVTL